MLHNNKLLAAFFLILSLNVANAQTIGPVPGSGGTAEDITVGTTTITGGTNTNILYDNNGVLGEYNASSTRTFLGLATNSAVAFDSLALGGATIGSNKLAVTGTSAFGDISDVGEITRANNDIIFKRGSTQVGRLGASQQTFLQLALGASVSAPDVFFARDADNTLAQRNGTNAQAFRLYNTYTDASNYERGGLTWNTNVLTLQTANGGTGTARGISISPATNIVTINNIVKLTCTTIANLPATPTQGMIGCVTDGDTLLVWGNTVVNSGAGATFYTVNYNGTNWTVIGS